MNFALSEVAKVVKESKSKMEEMDEKMSQIKDGKDADDEAITQEATKRTTEALKPLIPTIEAIENDLPQLGAKIRDGLELLPEGEKLVIEAIEGLRKELDELRKIKTQSFSNGGGGNANKAVYYYDLSGSLDGTKSYSLPSMARIISIHLSSFPNILRDTIDYSYNPSTHTLTFTDEIDADALSAGQTCVIIYSL